MNIGKQTNINGFSLLLAVVLTGAISISIVVSILLIGVDSSKTSLAIIHSNQAKAIANACVEQSLQKIRNSTIFTGYGNLIFADGSCGYFVIDDGGQNRTITVSSTVATAVRKVRVSINAINPKIIISSWQEGNF